MLADRPFDMFFIPKLTVSVLRTTSKLNVLTRELSSQFQNFSVSKKLFTKNNAIFQQTSRSLRNIRDKNITKHHKLIPETNNAVSNQQPTFRGLVLPTGFVVAVGMCSFSGCMVWQYENMRVEAKRMLNRAQRAYTHTHGKAGGIRQTINTYWNDLGPGTRVVSTIVGLNIAVFLLWKAPRLQPLMLKYFCSSPTAGMKPRCWSMLLSTFSHYSLFHIGANMYVLWSFAPIVTQIFGKEQFLAFYISAGMVSSLASYLSKTIRPSMVRSLGASGAIMAVLGAVCISYPDARLSIAFVGDLFPHSFSADNAMKGLIMLDLAGLLLGWKYLDHAAHLGGMLFGLWYVKYGHQMIWHRREKVMQLWHNIRGKP